MVRGNGTGFTYVGLLFAVALAGVALALAGVVSHTAGKRAKEEQLLFAGSAIRDAIDRYYRRTPGAAREYPQTLQELVEDRRYITVERHLRKIYVDPITGSRNWGLITSADGRIVGVYSESREAPLKRGHFRDEFASFAEAKSYNEWKFSAVHAQATSVNASGVGDSASDQPRPRSGAAR